jgi:integrase
MARPLAPWYRADRNEWVVEIHGVRHPLGKHPDGAKTPRRSPSSKKWIVPTEIDKAFHELLTQLHQTATQGSLPTTVDEILDQFLIWCQAHRASMTTVNYQNYFLPFINAPQPQGQGFLGQLPWDKLTPAQVITWLQAQTSWGPRTKRNFLTTLIRAFNWAKKNLGLPHNPFTGMEKPRAQAPLTFVTEEEFTLILPRILPEFRDLLTATYDTGARPQEINRLEARHLDLINHRAVFPTEESKGKRFPRVIYFPTERSLEIIQRLARKYPEGLIFRNAKGNPWNHNSVKCAFIRLDKIVGRRLTQYMFRRAFITRAILNGVDSHVVAKLAGHTSTQMIDQHYSAIAADQAFLLEQARKIRPDQQAPP